MYVVHNEKVKLRANALNVMATSSFALGVLAPIAGSFYNLGVDRAPVHSVITGMALWLFAAHWLHNQARRVIEELRE